MLDELMQGKMNYLHLSKFITFNNQMELSEVGRGVLFVSSRLKSRVRREEAFDSGMSKLAAMRSKASTCKNHRLTPL